MAYFPKIIIEKDGQVIATGDDPKSIAEAQSALVDAIANSVMATTVPLSTWAVSARNRFDVFVNQALTADDVSKYSPAVPDALHNLVDARSQAGEAVADGQWASLKSQFDVVLDDVTSKNGTKYAVDAATLSSMCASIVD